MEREAAGSSSVSGTNSADQHTSETALASQSEATDAFSDASPTPLPQKRHYRSKSEYSAKKTESEPALEPAPANNTEDKTNAGTPLSNSGRWSFRKQTSTSSLDLLAAFLSRSSIAIFEGTNEDAEEKDGHGLTR